MCKILVVVDMQANFIEETGAEHIVPKVACKIVSRRKEGYEIVMTSDKSGGELNGAIAEACGSCKTFKKHSYGCEELMLYLKQRSPDRVEFVGVCTDICVITNVLAAITVLPFADIAVDGDCCASASAEGQRSALRVMKSCNINL